MLSFFSRMGLTRAPLDLFLSHVRKRRDFGLASRYILFVKLDPDICYQALLTREARFDGRFFVGVATTGIYCRPVCPVKTPRRKNCSFFPSAAAAESAGFRPCLRCRPELAPVIRASRRTLGLPTELRASSKAAFRMD